MSLPPDEAQALGRGQRCGLGWFRGRATFFGSLVTGRSPMKRFKFPIQHVWDEQQLITDS